MKKIRKISLDAETLNVESFEVVEVDADARGTVQGHEAGNGYTDASQRPCSRCCPEW